MKYTHATISHRGGRKVNEDASGNLIHTAGACFAVADGLGGHGGGDVASKIAVETIVGAYRNHPEFSSVRVGTLLELAQQAILMRQQEDCRLSRMRSTAVVLLLEDAKAWWAHVGDTRLYHFADGHIVHQTKDHSVPQAMLDAGFAEESLDGSWRPYRPVGCSSCNLGYKGRVGIYQVMPISEEIQRIILADGSVLDIAKQSEREGVRSLRQSGLRKVQMGLTSLEEVLAVTNE